MWRTRDVLQCVIVYTQSWVNKLEANKSRVVMLCGNSREGSQKGSDASLFVSLW